MRDCCRQAEAGPGHTGDQALVVAALRALAHGQALLHPTETLPGLAFDPRLAAGAAVLTAVKGRAAGKPCLGLVPDLAAARRFFAPLPAPWDRALGRLWPGPLSIVWTASAAAPAALVGGDGTIGLRVPALAPDAAWLLLLLRALALPLPTTSVNASGAEPLTTWSAARAFCAGAAFVPDWAPHADAFAGAPSTIVSLRADGAHAVLREGALSAAALREALA